MAQRRVVRLHQQHRQEPFFSAGFSFTVGGLTPRDTPATDGEWLECLHDLQHVKGNVYFWLGDLMAYGEGRWGEVSVQQMVEATGYDYKTLAKFKWVASQIDGARRRMDLGFSHHEAVADLPLDQQEFVLTRAEDEHWTREMVRHEVNRLGCETERSAGPPILSGLHHGDCRQVLATLPDASIDLLLTEPPTDGPDALRLVEDVLRTAAGKLKPNSHAYIFVDTWETYIQVAPIVERHLELRNALLWVTDPPDASGECYWIDQHAVILFAQTGRRHLNGAREGNVLSFDPVAAPLHPQEKPVPLLQHFIEKSTQPKEIVLDPFMGTGNTCVAARNIGRSYIGIEIDSHWHEEAQRRLAPAVVG